MEEAITSFITWCIWGIFFICLAVYIWFSKKAISFWGNKNTFEVTDIRRYNHALSKLYGAYGIVFILLGLPFLAGHPECVFLSIAGVVMESIALIVFYSLVIKKKYKK